MNAYMPGEAWRKSSHSGANNDCIEVGGRPGAVAVRDTKDPHGPALAFAPRRLGRLHGGAEGQRPRPPRVSSTYDSTRVPARGPSCPTGDGEGKGLA
jgi:hypothetical protein